MNIFQPREVEANAPWRWAREAVGLIGRRPFAFGLSSLTMLVMFFALLQVEQTVLRLVIVLIAPPIGIGGFIRLARAADHSQPVSFFELLPTNRDVARILGLAVIGYGLAFALVAAVKTGMGASGLDLELGVLADHRWRNYLSAVASMLGLPLMLVVKGVLFGISLAAFSSLLLILFAWFVLPLIELSNVRTALALRLSISAYRLNARRIGLASVGILAAMVVLILLTLGLTAMLIAPFVGALLYVSYREVFLGQAENSPALVKRQFNVADASV